MKKTRRSPEKAEPSALAITNTGRGIKALCDITNYIFFILLAHASPECVAERPLTETTFSRLPSSQDADWLSYASEIA